MCIGDSLEAGSAAEDERDAHDAASVSYTQIRAHETVLDLVCRLQLEKKKKTYIQRRTDAITRFAGY